MQKVTLEPISITIALPPKEPIGNHSCGCGSLSTWWNFYTREWALCGGFFPFLQLSFNGRSFISDFVFHFYILKLSQLGFKDFVTIRIVEYSLKLNETSSHKNMFKDVINALRHVLNVKFDFTI